MVEAWRLVAGPIYDWENDEDCLGFTAESAREVYEFDVATFDEELSGLLFATKAEAELAVEEYGSYQDWFDIFVEGVDVDQSELDKGNGSISFVKN